MTTMRAEIKSGHIGEVAFGNAAGHPDASNVAQHKVEGDLATNPVAASPQVTCDTALWNRNQRKQEFSLRRWRY
jgi:hypothetical protein